MTGDGTAAERGYVRIPALGSAAALREHVASLGLALPCDDAILPAPASPMARPLPCGPFTAGNRWCIHPMEGWDGEADGRPSDHTDRKSVV